MIKMNFVWYCRFQKSFIHNVNVSTFNNSSHSQDSKE
jgi:hypothetical protein